MSRFRSGEGGAAIAPRPRDTDTGSMLQRDILMTNGTKKLDDGKRVEETS